MKKKLSILNFLLFCLLLLPAYIYAIPIESKTVFCNGVECGTMQIDKYSEYKTMWLGGVEIDGQFVEKKELTYHYIQSINVYDDPTPKVYTDGSALPVPLIDTPPGGYQNDTFDYLVYYDQTEFPTFYDMPSTYMLDAITEPDNKLQLSFETWLVCVIEETFGPKNNQAKDDTYNVASLLGWTWGYSSEWPKTISI